MAIVKNEIDKILQAAATRTSNDPSAAVDLLPRSAVFKDIGTGGDPASFTFNARLLALEGSVVFSATGGTLTSVTATAATLTFANMTADSATVTATVTSNGQTYSASSVVAKVRDGVDGTSGVARYVEISTSGGQVFSRANSAGTFAPASITLTATPYGGSASAYQWQFWNGTAWANPATGATTATYVVDNTLNGLTGSSAVFRVQATIGGAVFTDEMTLAQLTGGANGANGISAITGFLTNESVTLAADNAGTVSSFTPASGTFKVYDGITDKTGTPVTYSVALQTSCTVAITTAGDYSVSAMAADTASATLQAVYGGVTVQKVLSLAKSKAGTNGGTGQAGASYVTAYCASATGSATSAPAATTGKTSLPAANSGGITGTWSSTVPTLTAGQYLYQTDGIYDPATNQVAWSIPYWSSLKVGSLSAITANLGTVNAGNVNLGAGKIVLSDDGSATMKALTVTRTDGTVLLDVNGLKAVAAAPGTVNSDLVPSIDSAATTATWNGVSGTGKPSDNATSDVTLESTGGIVITGNRAIKSSGTAAWNAQVTSKESYVGGAYASVKAEGLVDVMFGLNVDPATDSSHISIDYRLYLNGAGGLDVYDPAYTPNVGTYVTGDVLSVVFDGSIVRYMKNGTVLKTTTPAAPITAPLYLDSSFFNIGNAVSNIRFGPLSSNNWSSVGGTGKPSDNATVGAPAGTNVGSTPATTVEAGAANGTTALNTLGSAMSVTPLTTLNPVGGTNTYGTVGTRTASVSGGTAPYTYLWSITYTDANDTGGYMDLTDADSATVTVKSYGFNTTVYGRLTCVITDSGARVKTVSCSVIKTHGTPP